MTYKNTLISFIILVAAGTALWVTLLSYRPQSLPITKTASLPDAFMEEVNAVIMDKYGKPSMKINTPKMIHFAANDTTQLISPQLTLYRKSPKPWYITSRFAKATAGIENVHFWDDVMIHHPADLDNPATLIKTNTLLVHPNNKTAETNDPITMIQPNITVRATGMFADMNTGDIKLLSQASGEYAPSS